MIKISGEGDFSSPVQEAVAHAIETSAGIAGGLLWKGNFDLETGSNFGFRINLHRKF